MSLLTLDASLRTVLDGLAAFTNAEVIARGDAAGDVFDRPHAMYTPSGAYADEILELRRLVRVAAAREGYYQMCVPESLGGGGEGAVTWFAAWEQIFRTTGMRYSVLAHEVIAHWATGPSIIFEHASAELKTGVLAELMSGAKSMCFAMSEPEAGSDVWAMGTRAVRDGDGWLITGTKQWITNGPYADYALVFAVTDGAAATARRGGISVFVVDVTEPGFSVDRVIRLYGHPGGNEGILSFNAVRVPSSAMVGAEGEGMKVGLAGLALGRLYNAAKSVGLARWAFEQGLPYARERRTFGRALIEHQSIAFKFADAAADTLAAHLLALHAASLFDSGEDALVETSMAKIFGTEMGCRVIDHMIQVHGGMGLTSELGLAEAWQELRTVQIADGSAEMLRRVIGGRIAKKLPVL